MTVTAVRDSPIKSAQAKLPPANTGVPQAFQTKIRLDRSILSWSCGLRPFVAGSNWLKAVVRERQLSAKRSKSDISTKPEAIQEYFDHRIISDASKKWPSVHSAVGS